ncbi:MAG: UbiA prenyltransferase family protein [Solirubrobacteraceae bacterium]
MLTRPGRPAFYALGGGRMGDALTLLHPPYTAWHLSYFALGAGLAPHVRANRLLWGLAAFALAVGVAAHALDELHDRPLGSGFSDRSLRAAAGLSMLGALAIGVGGAVAVSPWLIPLVLAGALFLPAYNLELAGGRFHSDLWFAVGWGAFPAFTGWFAQTLRVEAAGVLIALACIALSLAQRRLSSAARELRRRPVAVEGVRRLPDGSSEPLSRAVLLNPLDGALAMLSVAMVVLAAALLSARL